MTSQQSRPSWFRMAALTNRTPAPTPALFPTTATTRPSTPAPTRSTTPAPAPTPGLARPLSRVATPIRPPPLGPGVVRPAVPIRPSSPPTTTLPSPPPAPLRSPIKSTPASAPPSPPRTPATPTPRSPPATKSPMKTSPIKKPTMATSSYAPTVSKGVDAAKAINHRSLESLQRNPMPSPTPSPFTSPSALTKREHQHEPKIDRKNVLVQDKPMSKSTDYHNNVIPSIRKTEPTVTYKGTGKNVHDPEELGMRFITLAGENRGAVMELNPYHKKNYPLGISHILQKNKDTKTTTYNDKANRSKTMQSPSMDNLNSNIQGINNSILLDSNFENTDPGIHLTLT